ncbi:MAG: hypothetical protein GEV28_04510 [Actinophytocola sp.]|uniref:hypothetical protein n=1 Tax=Actinophytocola sp. TaxID=1872138 RepID=UPI001320E921|nr:hypothetical protein [Actinophytocola sp.]MPZ79684.1 hypothetical protein [Actinophytocola sp.]
MPNLVLVPRSTARIHTPHDRERIAWETYGLLTTAEHGGHIAVISQYMRRHLRSDCHVPDNTLVELPDGLSPADWHLSPPANGHPLPAPAHQGFLLAMGRAQPYKGTNHRRAHRIRCHTSGFGESGHRSAARTRAHPH